MTSRNPLKVSQYAMDSAACSVAESNTWRHPATGIAERNRNPESASVAGSLGASSPLSSSSPAS
eukprot:12134497-Alexandrium_andersonii.AAC.1